MNRRRFLLSATAIAGSVGFYGCSNPTDPTERRPRPPEPLKICLHGDTHAGYTGSETIPPSEVVHSKILHCFGAYKPNVIFNLGDLIHNLGTDQWAQFGTMTSDVRSWARYLPVFGNHDSGDGGIEAFLSFFNGNLPTNGENRVYYWLRHEDVLFVVLDVHVDQPASLAAQREWLRQTLQEHADAVFRFVLFHIPPWTTAGRGPFPFARIFDPDLQEFAVDVVFNGHIHAYERFEIRGVQYVVSGGAGGFGCSDETRRAHCLDTNTDTAMIAPFRQAGAQTNNYVRLEILGNQATVIAFDVEGNEIDAFIVSKDETATAVG